VAKPSKALSYKEWTSRLVSNLADYFNLAGWKIYVRWDDKGIEDSGDSIYAMIHVNTPYHFADLTFHPPSKRDFESKDVGRLVECVVHELTHIFLAPFEDWLDPHLSKTTRPLFENTLESQTQKLTTVLLKNLPDAIIPPIK
jgi:hypothetical protein